MCEKVALNEAGCRVGKPLAIWGLIGSLYPAKKDTGIVIGSLGNVKMFSGRSLRASPTATRWSGDEVAPWLTYLHREAVSFNARTRTFPLLSSRWAQRDSGP